MQNLLRPHTNTSLPELFTFATLLSNNEQVPATRWGNSNSAPTLASMAPTSASAKVFSTYELLERILKQPRVDTFDLFCAQHVATAWRDVCKRSAILRKNLFLEPCDAEHTIKRYEGFRPAGYQIARQWPSIVFELHTALIYWHWGFCFASRWQRMPRNPDINWMVKDRENPQARAFATQPPATKIRFQMYFDREPLYREISNEAGVTLGEFADVLLYFEGIDVGPLQSDGGDGGDEGFIMWQICSTNARLDERRSQHGKAE